MHGPEGQVVGAPTLGCVCLIAGQPIHPGGAQTAWDHAYNQLALAPACVLPITEHPGECGDVASFPASHMYMQAPGGTPLPL